MQTQTERQAEKEQQRRMWKRTVKVMVTRMVCCTDQDCKVVGETKTTVDMMCMECHQHTTMTWTQ